jgi:folate-binding protein YgfZ
MSSVDDQVLSLRKCGGYCRDGNLTAIEITGPQAAEFLQARLSNDVLALAPGHGQLTCFLDRQAKILAVLSLHRLAESFWALVPRAQGTKVLQLLEEFHFREQVAFRTLSDLEFFCVHGAKSELVLVNSGAQRDQLIDEEWAIASVQVCGKTSTVIRCSNTGERGLIFAGTVSEELENATRALGMIPLSHEAIETACIENGRVENAFTGLMMAETGLEATATSYTKGCFPGQEVLARIRTYGAPKQGLIGLVFSEDTKPNTKLAHGSSINLNSKEAGTVVAAAHSPTLARFIAIAMMQREHRVPGQKLEVAVNGAPFTVTTVILPFINKEDSAAKSKSIYARALKEFTDGSEEAAARMLDEAIELDPTFADAYETLGVILNRLDRLDEAIAMMKQLAILDPQSIMAHANLSVFYMQKGDKTAAEDEKALAMSIRMSQMARSIAAEQEERKRQAANKADAEKRLSMFEQVLKIDPADFLANAGVGSVYVDLEQYDRAIEPLKKALATRPNHTVAYVALGQAYEKLDRISDAVETYRKGIAVASQRGDGEPLKKMQIRLEQLATKMSN